MMAFLQEKDDATVSFDRINKLVEFLWCFPLEVHKDKNASHDMNDCLHMRTDSYLPSKPKAAKTELDRATKITVFVWSKLCDQSKNISQTFRIFDSKDKGKLSKKDFVDGLEKFSIQLSTDDSTLLWNSLDIKKRGYLIFEDFSKIHVGEKLNLMEDPYL